MVDLAVGMNHSRAAHAALCHTNKHIHVPTAAPTVSHMLGGPCSSSALSSHQAEHATMRLFTELCGSSLPCFPTARASAAAAKDGDTEEPEQAVEALKQGLCNVNTFLDKIGSGGPFLFGEQFSPAKCNIAPFLQRACVVLPSCTSADPIKMCEEHDLMHAKAWIEAVTA